MENPGETLVGDYLRHVKGCDFVDLNVYTTHAQGEIDVIAINNDTKQVYICEVVTHLTTGLQYVKDKRPDSGPRLLKKFRKDIEYGNRAFEGYCKHYMLWSPIVKDSKGKDEYNQFYHLNLLKEGIRNELGVEVECVINEQYLEAIHALRKYAREETKELKSPIMRFLQIEEYSKKRSTRKAQEPSSHRRSFENK